MTEHGIQRFVGVNFRARVSSTLLGDKPTQRDSEMVTLLSTRSMSLSSL